MAIKLSTDDDDRSARIKRWARHFQLFFIFLAIGVAVVALLVLFSFPLTAPTAALIGVITFAAIVINYKTSPSSIFQKLVGFFLKPEVAKGNEKEPTVKDNTGHNEKNNQNDQDSQDDNKKNTHESANLSKNGEVSENLSKKEEVAENRDKESESEEKDNNVKKIKDNFHYLLLKTILSSSVSADDISFLKKGEPFKIDEHLLDAELSNYKCIGVSTQLKTKEFKRKFEILATKESNKELFDIKELGAGAYGVVFEVKPKSTAGKNKVSFAVKVAPKNDRSIVREIEALKKIKHENIIGIEGFFNDVNFHYVILPKLDMSLGGLLKEKGKLCDDETKKMALEVSKGLEFLHDSKYVHHDIKPDNILVKFVGRVFLGFYIADFGYASMQDEEINPRGTPLYSAPEKINHFIKVSSFFKFTSFFKADSSQDNYSLGCVIFTCVTGEIPFQTAQNLQDAVMLKNNTKEIQRHSEKCGSFERIVADSLQIKPEKRPTALAMYAQVEKIEVSGTAQNSCSLWHSNKKDLSCPTIQPEITLRDSCLLAM